MACYHPLKGFKIGINPSTGNDKLKISPYTTDHVELRPDGKYYNVSDNSVSPFAKAYTDFVDIPCGRCIGCRLTRSKQWADRAVLELQYHDSNYFLTITYDDDHIPSAEYTVPDTGEIGESLTLDKKDLQQFWKNLRQEIKRNQNGYKIRYLAAGEYGETTLRPHYHAIVFGLEIPDLKVYKKTLNGDILYTSAWLNKIWKKGNIWIGEATWESIAYVARYVTKKLTGPEAKYYETFNLVPEFLVCSRKPGIGRQYYEDHKNDLFENSRYHFPRSNGIGSACPSRYFSNLFEADFDTESVENRKNALKAQFEARKALKLENTSQNYLDYLLTEEYNKIKSTGSLKRNAV